jgi:hypothetical protein
MYMPACLHACTARAASHTRAHSRTPAHKNTHTELRRHKRQFVKLATKMAFSRLHDAASAQRLFVEHLRVQLAQE